MKHVQIKHMLQCLLIAASSSAIISCGGSTSTNGTSDTSSSTSTDTSVTPAATVTHAEAIISGTKADTTVDGKASFDADNGKVKLMVGTYHT